MDAFYDVPAGMTQIARCMTFGCSSRRDIVRRLMGSCSAFSGLSFADAAATFRAYERQGLVSLGDGYVAIYHQA